MDAKGIRPEDVKKAAEKFALEKHDSSDFSAFENLQIEAASGGA